MKRVINYIKLLLFKLTLLRRDMYITFSFKKYVEPKELYGYAYSRLIMQGFSEQQAKRIIKGMSKCVKKEKSIDFEATVKYYVNLSELKQMQKAV